MDVSAWWYGLRCVDRQEHIELSNHIGVGLSAGTCLDLSSTGINSACHADRLHVSPAVSQPSISDVEIIRLTPNGAEEKQKIPVTIQRRNAAM